LYINLCPYILIAPETRYSPGLGQTRVEALELTKVKRILLVQISSPEHYSLWNALSIETLAGQLRGVFKEGVTVDLGRIRKSDDIAKTIRTIESFQPHIIGVSPELGSLKWTDRLLTQIYEIISRFPEKPLIVFGNKLATYHPNYFVERYQDSIVVIGEGEESLCGLVEHVRGRRLLENVPNLVYQIEKNKIHKTDPRPVNYKRLVFPPAIDLIKPSRKRPSNVLVQSSRGCSWSGCSYCTVHSFHGNPRWTGLPIPRVLTNIKQLVEKGVSEFEFADDDFIGGRSKSNIERAYRLADGLAKLDKQITFRAFFMPHEIFIRGQEPKNKEITRLLLRLKEVGLVRIYFGIESGCISQLRRYNRCMSHRPDFKIEDIEEAIRHVRDDLVLDVDVGFLMFDPFLKLDEMVENIQFFRTWKIIKGNQWPFRPIAINSGSLIYEQIKDLKDDNTGSNLLGDFDLEYMSYEYKFKNPEVQCIHDKIDTLSSRTSKLFYALKIISKQQYCKKKKTKETRKAQWYVERNGLIYLDLMESLAAAKSRAEQDKQLIRAKKRLNQLVMQLGLDIKKNLFPEHGRQLSRKLPAAFKQHERCSNAKMDR
jgi:hypothetical protein